jgi:hypothetical protein
MVFTESVDKTFFLYTDASRADTTDSSVKRRKTAKRPSIP